MGGRNSSLEHSRLSVYALEQRTPNNKLLDIKQDNKIHVTRSNMNRIVQEAQEAQCSSRNMRGPRTSPQSGHEHSRSRATTRVKYKLKSSKCIPLFPETSELDHALA
jgi:hypothetical protein